jgi:hypothetical protein
MTSRVRDVLSSVFKPKKKQTHVIPSEGRRTFDRSKPVLNITNEAQVATLRPEEALAVARILDAKAQHAHNKAAHNYKKSLNGRYFHFKKSSNGSPVDTKSNPSKSQNAGSKSKKSRKHKSRSHSRKHKTRKHHRK